MNAFSATVRQELLSSRRERMPQALLAVFLAMVSVSALIGWISNRTVTSVYDKTAQAGLTTAPNPFSGVSPLSYARNAVIYVVLIGALLAIVLGVSSVLRNRRTRTADLVLSRPGGARTHLAAKLVGLAIWLVLVVLAATAITWLSILVIQGRPLTVGESARLVGFYVLAWAFLLVFVVLGMLCGLYSRRETTALLAPIVAWSVITFVVPQLGTAALPVSLLNPVPAVPVQGGPFAAVQGLLGPLSVTEHLKTAAGLLLRNDAVTGSAATAVAGIAIPLAIGVGLLLTTKRDRLRSDLHE